MKINNLVSILSLSIIQIYSYMMSIGYADARIASGDVVMWDASEEALQNFASSLLFERGILLSGVAAGRVLHLQVTLKLQFAVELELRGISKHYLPNNHTDTISCITARAHVNLDNIQPQLKVRDLIISFSC